MNIREKRLENSKIELQVDVPTDKVELEYQSVFLKLQKTVAIDGFRKGKAPLQLVETRFLEQADKEVAQNLLHSMFLDAITEKQFTPIVHPRYSFDRIKRGEPFSFTALFEVPPTLTIGKYREIHADERAVTITDSDIEDEINAMREKDAKIEKKADDGIVQNGNFVKIKVKRVDDIGNGESDKVDYKDYSILVGKSKDSSALDKHTIGMKAGEEKEVDVKYPKNYYMSDLAGQKATYKVKIEEINDFIMPTLDDEFAKKMNFESASDLRQKTKEHVEKFAAEKLRGEVKAKILQAIISNSTYDIPETMVFSEMNVIFRRTQERIGYYAETLEKFSSALGINQEEFANKLKEEATQAIKTTLTLSEIVKKEDLKVSKERYDEVVGIIAKRNGKTVQEIEELIEKNNSRENIETELLLDQAMDLIYTSGKVKKLKPIQYHEFIQSIS